MSVPAMVSGLSQHFPATYDIEAAEPSPRSHLGGELATGEVEGS